jgi:hypothetical protein
MPGSMSSSKSVIVITGGVLTLLKSNILSVRFFKSAKWWFEYTLCTDRQTDREVCFIEHENVAKI